MAVERTGGGEVKNRLGDEKSVYLRGHAGNPVGWWPWCEEAFAAAREQDKPVFLSVGYSTCHWCHVMERETFEDAEAARRLNEVFVPVKVDREERPDVDGVYIRVCQMMAGTAGWPLTVVLTPEKKPIFAGTYLPKRSSGGRLGVMDLCERVEALWRERREELETGAREVVKALREAARPRAGEGLTMEHVAAARQWLVQRFDGEYGGFGGAPKFPSAHTLLFLLRGHAKWGRAEDVGMVERTLEGIRRGGVYDQVGLGVHRYSTDEQWRVPHFEKMLYDQAMLAMACLEAQQATGKERYGRWAQETLDYALRDLRGKEGGFYTAEDADSEGREGKFYLWTEEDLAELASGEEPALLRAAFGVTREGNYTEEGTGQGTGENILHRGRGWTEVAAALGQEEGQVREQWEVARRKLLAARGRRVRPLRDEKVLTDWNGLMIAALARGGLVLGEAGLVEAAAGATQFVLERLVDGRGRLLHRWEAGTAGIEGHLDDYAFFVWGLVELYEATLEKKWLGEAVRWTETMIEKFRAATGGYYFTAAEAPEVLVRGQEAVDGALPSGNAVAAENLVRLGAMTGSRRLEEEAREVFRAFSGQVGRLPAGYVHLLGAFGLAEAGMTTVTVVGDREETKARALVSAAREGYDPGRVVVLREPKGQGAAEAEAVLCTGPTCEAPVREAGALRRRLAKTTG